MRTVAARPEVAVAGQPDAYPLPFRCVSYTLSEDDERRLACTSGTERLVVRREIRAAGIRAARERGASLVQCYHGDELLFVADVPSECEAVAGDRWLVHVWRALVVIDRWSPDGRIAPLQTGMRVTWALALIALLAALVGWSLP